MSFSNSTQLPRSWTAWSHQFQSHGALIAIAIAVAIFFKSNVSRIIAVWPFFTRRYDFITSNLKKTGRNVFSFNVLHHSVTAFQGVSARRALFDDKNLDFNEGYKILMGAAPRLSDIQIDSDSRTDVFNKRIAFLFNKDRLSEVLPTLFDDIQMRMDRCGKQGVIDPFKDVYNLVFQMTVRMASCRELASDLHALTELQRHYWILEKSATPTSLLFPWLPSPAKRAKEASTKALFTMLQDYVEERRKAPVPNSDAVDMLLGLGMSHEDIVGFILGVIFAGVINTGINACWILLYISTYAQWKSAIYAEVHALLAQYTNPSDPLHKRLSTIPLTAWEDEMPSTDLALRETIRLVVNGTVLRRNLVGRVKLSEVGEVPSGGFLAYSLSDAHMNPRIYTDPGLFDPERFSPGREEDKREPYAFLGWGAGRHPCTGMKIAKLEIKMIVALFVVGYEFDVVDSRGRTPERLPIPDYNDIQQARPKGEPCFLKFKRVVE